MRELRWRRDLASYDSKQCFVDRRVRCAHADTDGESSLQLADVAEESGADGGSDCHADAWHWSHDGDLYGRLCRAARPVALSPSRTVGDGLVESEWAQERNVGGGLSRLEGTEQVVSATGGVEWSQF